MAPVGGYAPDRDRDPRIGEAQCVDVLGKANGRLIRMGPWYNRNVLGQSTQKKKK